MMTKLMAIAMKGRRGGKREMKRLVVVVSQSFTADNQRKNNEHRNMNRKEFAFGAQMGTKLRSRSEAEVNFDRRPNRKEITFVARIGRKLRSQAQSEGKLDLRPSRKDFTIADRVGRT